jgi:hypothetical protein
MTLKWFHDNGPRSAGTNKRIRRPPAVISTPRIEYGSITHKPMPESSLAREFDLAAPVHLLLRSLAVHPAGQTHLAAPVQQRMGRAIRSATWFEDFNPTQLLPPLGPVLGTGEQVPYLR